MPTVTAQAIINQAAFTLQDVANVRWTRAELLGYVNDGQRDLCLIKPDAYAINASAQLVAGTRQTIPADGNAFVRIVRNMGAAGTTPGRAPRQIALTTMDQQNPNWHSATPAAVVQEYVYDDRDPKIFYVSPPQPAANMGYIDLLYHASPANLALEASTIILDDVYKTALVNYVIYRAYLKEGEFTNPTGAMAHRSEFLNLLGFKEKSEGNEKAGA